MSLSRSATDLRRTNDTSDLTPPPARSAARAGRDGDQPGVLDAVRRKRVAVTDPARVVVAGLLWKMLAVHCTQQWPSGRVGVDDNRCRITQAGGPHGGVVASFIISLPRGR